jgi:hypothetical protein
MNEPRRLLQDNPSGLERALLSAGAAYRSSDATRQKTLAALGLVGTAAATAGVAASSSSVLPKFVPWKLVALSGLGVAVLTPVSVVAWKYVAAPAQTQVARVVAPAPPPPRIVPPPAAGAPVIPPEASSPPALEVPVQKADVRGPSASALSAELGVLDAARSKLAAGDARGALVVLDEYAKTYPRGHLGLEAEVLRIDALSRAGETSAARKRAEAFLKRHPKSVLAARVRRYLDDPR